MEFKIITDTENPLFNRREIQGEIKSGVSPSREKVIELVSEKIKTPKENIKIRTIQARFGSKVFLIVANIYSSEADKKEIEGMSKKEKQIQEKSKQQNEKLSDESVAKIEKIPEQQKPTEKIKEEKPIKNKEQEKTETKEKKIKEGAKEKVNEENEKENKNKEN